MDHLCYFCLVLLCFHARLYVDALWSPAGKGLTSWLSFVMANCHFLFGILGQVWCLIVSIPDFCPLSYFVMINARCCFFTLNNLWSCQRVCDALRYLLDNIIYKI